MARDDDKTQSVSPRDALTRRGFLATSGGLASLGLGLLSQPGTPAHGKVPDSPAPQPPYDSLRDWVAALEAHGLLLRMGDVDQDAFHATGLFFNLTDQYTWFGAPAMLFDRVRIDGEWFDGPLLANLQGHLSTDSIIWGLETRPGEAEGNYRRAKEYMRKVFRENGNAWPYIDPVELPAAESPCKEVILRGDEIDLTKFAFIQTNPADGGREVSNMSDLTLGEYVRLLQNPDRWAQLNLEVDRATFTKDLEEICTIRNDVMHFDPDGIGQGDLDKLRTFAQFLQRLHQITGESARTPSAAARITA